MLAAIAKDRANSELNRFHCRRLHSSGDFLKVAFVHQDADVSPANGERKRPAVADAKYDGNRQIVKNPNNARSRQGAGRFEHDRPLGVRNLNPSSRRRAFFS
jgi:hypothetical protein